MKECSKSIARRLSDSKFINHYFKGKGVDIGGKPDPLSLYQSLFCQMGEVKTWDWEDGDAQYMNSAKDEEYDFVHSSHCLEHLVDPKIGIKNWFRVLKAGGHMIITVPDEDLYEQGVFPSEFNRDHKWTFTIYKNKSWSDKSINVIEMLKELGDQAEIIKIEQLTSTYRFDLPRYDQTLTPVAECGIEIIIRKRNPDEVSKGGRYDKEKPQPDKEMRIHLNQYVHDMNMMKKNNNNQEPFTNDSEII